MYLVTLVQYNGTVQQRICGPKMAASMAAHYNGIGPIPWHSATESFHLQSLGGFPALTD